MLGRSSKNGQHVGFPRPCRERSNHWLVGRELLSQTLARNAKKRRARDGQRRRRVLQRAPQSFDGLGVDGKGAHTHYEQMYISSIEPRARLLHRLYQTLR